MREPGHLLKFPARAYHLGSHCIYYSIINKLMEIYSLAVLVAVTSLVVDLGLDCSPSLSKRISTLFIKGLIFIKLKEKHIVTIAFLVLLTVADIIEVEIFFHLVWIDVNLCEDIASWSLTLKVNGFVLR